MVDECHEVPVHRFVHLQLSSMTELSIDPLGIGIEVAAVPLPARDNLFMGFLAS